MIDRQTEKQTDGASDIQTYERIKRNRHTDRQADIQKETQTEKKKYNSRIYLFRKTQM